MFNHASKEKEGKLAYSPDRLVEGIAQLPITELPLLSKHILALEEVCLLHHDPFDAVLAAQATAEELYLVTADANLIGKGIQVINASC